MRDPAQRLELAAISGIDQVAAGEWDACAGDDNPFVRHAFLLALEKSGSATSESGWQPRHLVARDASGRMLAAAPLYLKTDSYGEYVFDWGWADAFRRAGGHYYPKLQLSVPFTPVPGPRLLVAPDAPAGTRRLLVRGLTALAEHDGVSSLHVTFPRPDELALLGEAGFLTRVGFQFHWHNAGYASFDDFLSDLSSRKRKAIRKERQAVGESGLTIRGLRGPEVEARHWEGFYRCYRANSDRKWGEAYLTRAFFDLVGETMAERIYLVVAEAGGRIIGGALNFIGREALFGRNWGCIERHRYLHFEACYYRAIDFAIAEGLTRVEAGVQGEHKIQRGYRPVETHSAHWIANPGFRDAIEHYLSQERRMVREERAALETLDPFRKD